MDCRLHGLNLEVAGRIAFDGLFNWSLIFVLLKHNYGLIFYDITMTSALCSVIISHHIAGKY